MIFRLLLLGIAIYLGSRIVGGLFKPPRPTSAVKGKSKNKPLDLSDDEVIDVDFKETKED